jgi:hypothetical protein
MTVGAIGVVTAGNSSAATYNHDVFVYWWGPERSSDALAQQDADMLTTTCRHLSGYGYPDRSSFAVTAYRDSTGNTGYAGMLRCYALR